MDMQENLFAAPSRPTRLVINLERVWTAGDDAVELGVTTYGSKTTGPVWSTSQLLQGPEFDRVLPEVLSSVVARWTGTLWSVEPKRATYEQWVALSTY